MNHAEVHSYMADYLEGDLDLTKRALLDAHLDGCSDCSREFAEMRGTIGLLRGLPSPEPPPFFVENVMRRIREGEGELRWSDRLRDWFQAVATPQIALPATALLVGLLMATGNLESDLLSRTLQTRGTQQSAAPISVVQSTSVRPPQVPVTIRPPAVVGAPRLTIALPIAGTGRVSSQVAVNDPGPNPFFTRRPARSIRNVVQPLPGSSGLSVRVALPSELAIAQGSAFDTDPQSAGSSQGERRTRELDERLDRMIRNPAGFSAEFADYSGAEQDLWLEALAERARETGRGQEALAELRLVGDRSALQLATRLSVELERGDPARSR